MKITTIGDIHGRTSWKKIVDHESDSDFFVFMGDYFDSYENIGGSKELANFLEILKFKNENSDKVILLIGNHDFHYLPGADGPYSRYIWKWQTQIREALEPAIKEGKLQTCFVKESYLFIHAGLTNTWAKANNVDLDNLEEYLNNYLLHNTSKFVFTPGEVMNPYGDEPCQGPFWVRPGSLSIDSVPGFRQIVGHTQVEDISLKHPKVILVDALGHAKKYLVINNKELEVKDV